MSDTYRRYRAIKRAMMQFVQPCPTGYREQHLNPLCALISGLPPIVIGIITSDD